eukprot:Hpha_TRINITY_DN15191_c4_g3::TRINITY_DN15191_c4_g3_i1::g.128364::m.128364/K12898/HNRNPF_H; heterogeneous nuclear ribonucleoprotein F/H
MPDDTAETATTPTAAAAEERPAASPFAASAASADSTATYAAQAPAVAGGWAAAGAPGTEVIIKLRGCPFRVTEAEISAFLSQGGASIVPGSCVIQQGPDGRPSGSVYVRVPSEMEAAKALAMQKMTLGSRYIELFRESFIEPTTTAVPGMAAGMGAMGTAMMGQGGMGAMGYGAGMGMGGYGTAMGMGAYGMQAGYGMTGMMGGMATAGAPLMTALRSGLASLGTTPVMPGDVVVKMRGLPYSSTELDIANFFNGISIAQQGIHLVMTHDDRPSGEAFVEFENPTDLQFALERDRQSMGTRYVEVFRSSKAEMQGGGAAGPGGSKYSPYGGQGGLSFRPGDWDCKDCGYHNFASRANCKQCGALNI